MNKEKATLQMDQKFEELHKLRNKIKLYEARADELKDEILKWMEDNNKAKIATDKFVVKAQEMCVERLSKKNVPTEVWKKYATSSNYTVLNIKLAKT